MHESVQAWVKLCVVEYDLSRRSVLELGSLNVNGSPRKHFRGPYLGIDIQAGPGVDMVTNAHTVDTVLTEQYDVTVCVEMLEHDDAPWLSMRAAHEVTAPGGMLIVTARGYDERGCWPLHNHPQDLWRFSVSGMTQLLHHTGWHRSEVIRDPEGPGVLGITHRDR
jgi:SAM-dependent methyltransferase